MITILGGKERDINFVVLDVRGGMKNVVEGKLKFWRLFFPLGSNVALPTAPV